VNENHVLDIVLTIFATMQNHDEKDVRIQEDDIEEDVKI